MKTPDWILEGFDSKADWEKVKGESRAPTDSKKGKTFNVKSCPKCGSTEVSVVLGGEEGKGSNGWECKACKWKGREIHEKELAEDEFLEHFDRMDEK